MPGYARYARRGLPREPTGAALLLRHGPFWAHRLGGDFFDHLEPDRLTRYYVKRLLHLGHKVTLESLAPLNEIFGAGLTIVGRTIDIVVR